METFFDPDTQQPVQQLALPEGGTKILGLKTFSGNDVAVRTGDYKIAYSDMVIHLNDTTKKKYDELDERDQHKVAKDTTRIETNGSFFVQIGGNNAGTTELTARFTTQGSAVYASPVTITVTANKKQLSLGKHFDELWRYHPLVPPNNKLYNPEHPDKVCPKSTWLAGQCMIRFSIALQKGGVTLNGLSVNKCGQPGKDHQHHYINPYDFEQWKGLQQAYVWEAKLPLQPEPMPGIAAYYFTMGRRGVILFRDYFATRKDKKDMAGGHIDLWNLDQMGNTVGRPTPGLSAFVRSRRVVFWPLE
jgi:hypothetical protein